MKLLAPLFHAAGLALTAGALVTAPSAQCLDPDGLDGPCCVDVLPTLPTFPAQSLPGSAICWDSCAVTSDDCVQLNLTAPTTAICGQYTSDLTTIDCGTGANQLGGTLILDYARTWEEFPTPGESLQVWRFLVKADLILAGVSTGTCPFPSCLPAQPTAFYYGYLDYARDCSTGAWESALVLYHGCDAFVHDPLISSRPGTFHPSTTYALVGPSTVTNPFVPVSLPAGGGPLFFEGIRDTIDLVTLACESRERLQAGNIVPLGNACACSFALAPPQTTARYMDGVSFCGSDFRSVNLFPFLPWFEVMSISIGSWSNGSSYPGPEAAWVEEGLFLHTEACSLSGTPQAYAEVKVGATTEGGYLAAIGLVVGDKFTDLVNNFSAALGSPITPPFVGNVMPSLHLISVNYF